MPANDNDGANWGCTKCRPRLRDESCKACQTGPNVCHPCQNDWLEAIDCLGLDSGSRGHPYYLCDRCRD